jgi:hypothetical protein
VRAQPTVWPVTRWRVWPRGAGWWGAVRCWTTYLAITRSRRWTSSELAGIQRVPAVLVRNPSRPRSLRISARTVFGIAASPPAVRNSRYFTVSARGTRSVRTRGRRGRAWSPRPGRAAMRCPARFAGRWPGYSDAAHAHARAHYACHRQPPPVASGTWTRRRPTACADPSRADRDTHPCHVIAR